MLEQLIDKLQNVDFSGTDGFLLLTVLLFPIFAVLIFLVQKFSIRRMRGILWRRNNSKKSRVPSQFLTQRNIAIITVILLALFKPGYDFYLTNTGEENAIRCYRPYITDGDTLRCNATRVRLYSIDAPEMAGHCKKGRKCVEGDPYATKDYLISLTRSIVSCTPIEEDHYGRTVATCESEQSENLSCDMVQAGHAIVRYGSLRCN